MKSVVKAWKQERERERGFGFVRRERHDHEKKRRPLGFGGSENRESEDEAKTGFLERERGRRTREGSRNGKGGGGNHFTFETSFYGLIFYGWTSLIYGGVQPCPSCPPTPPFERLSTFYWVETVFCLTPAGPASVPLSKNFGRR